MTTLWTLLVQKETHTYRTSDLCINDFGHDSILCTVEYPWISTLRQYVIVATITSIGTATEGAMKLTGQPFPVSHGFPRIPTEHPSRPGQQAVVWLPVSVGLPSLTQKPGFGAWFYHVLSLLLASLFIISIQKLNWQKSSILSCKKTPSD